MDLGLTNILLGGLVGLVGLGLLGYGRKEVRVPHMVVGLIFLVYPYFVGNAFAIVGIAVALVAALTLVSRLGF
jgi:hypothetical protein